MNEPHPNTVKREKQEKLGGWLSVYIEAEPCVVSGAVPLLLLRLR
jgi:hypothetical protein